VARNSVLRQRTAIEDDTQDLTRPPEQPPQPEPWPGGIWPTESPYPADRPGRVRVSASAALALAAGLVGLCATLTGLLAPEGFALGVLAILASLVGLARTLRPLLAGISLALLGLLAGAAAAGLAVLAITGHLRWLSSHTDAVPQWRDWLVAHWPWLGRW
jgi:hypothetical protein